MQDLFAPAQFGDFSDEQKLALPSFEPMFSGAVIAATEVAHGAPVAVDAIYEQQLVPPLDVAEPEPEHVASAADVFTALTATPPRRSPALTVAAPI